MRDPKRIPEMLSALHELWNYFPDLRLGQLIVSLNHNQDPFYLEDDKLLEKIKEAIDNLKQKG